MTLFSMILIVLMVGAVISVSFIKDLLAAVIVYMVFGLIMTVLWLQLNAPDLAITEAAVGVGITGILFVLTLKRVGEMKQ